MCHQTSNVLNSRQDDTRKHSALPYCRNVYTGDYAPSHHELDADKYRSWSKYIGDVWRLPPDRRIDFGFQKWYLEKLSAYDLKLRLEELQRFNNDLLGTETPIDSTSSKRRNWFRHLTIEDTLPSPPFESWSYIIGCANSRSSLEPTRNLGSDLSQQSHYVISKLGTQEYPSDADDSAFQHAPWQRLM